jgi:hypothetical protein
MTTAKKAPRTRQHQSPSPDVKHERIAIVGGGIAGLLCAYILSNDGHTVELFESSDVLGGRIRSFRFNAALLNKIERQNDDEREPVKGEAVLENALLPALLMSDSAKQAAKEKDPEYTPTPDKPLVLKPSDKESLVPEKEQDYRLYATEDYDKRLWDHLEFNAEFGPMRIELEVQRMLDFLLEHLNIPPLNEGPPTTIGKAHDLGRMQRFPPFSSPASAGDPLYDLKPEEEGKNPLELLRLGVCRAVVDLHFDFAEPPLANAGALEQKKVRDFEKAREDLTKKLHDAAATQRPTDPVFETWLRRRLREDAYWAIQRYGQIPVLYGAETYIKLHTMGFWNLMAAYLSHNALSKVRELGTFYHLIPENPNAAEWLTWWMRQISISSHLQGVFGGMQSVTEKLASKMGFPGHTHSNLTIHPATTVTRLTKKEDGQIGLALTDGKVHSHAFSRVVLALPTVPAEKLIQNSTLWGPEKTAQIDKKKFADYLHAALPFQLLKAFFVVRERWWEEDVRANPGATRYPTREVYFWKSRMKDSRRGLVMLYMDRPSAAFWANYVPRPTQDDIDELCRPKIDPEKATEQEKDDADREAREVATLRARIKSRFVEYVNENEGQKITPDDIIWCGIMDWGREPYGAASHAWRPNREYWNTLAQLADWTVDVEGKPAHIHVCGEAYSDYHAFIEGALRSSVHVLAQIRRTKRTEVQAKEEDAKKQRLLDIIRHLKPGLDVGSIRNAIEEDQREAEEKPAKRNQRKLVSANKADAKAKFGDDERYVKDFLEWSNKLDEIAGNTPK